MRRSAGALTCLFAAAQLLLNGSQPARAGSPLTVLMEHQASPLVELHLVIGAGHGHGPEGSAAASIAVASFLNAPRAGSPAGIWRLTRLGVKTGVIVGWEHTIVAMAVAAEQAPAVVEVLSSLISEPPIAQSFSVEAERQAQIDHALARSPVDRADRVARSSLWRPLGASTRRSEHLPADLAARDFAVAMYRPENIVLTIHGGYDPAAMAAALAKLQDRIIPAEPSPPVTPTPLSRVRTPPLQCIDNPGGGLAVLTVAQAVQLDTDRSGLAMQLLAHVLGGSLSSDLQHRVRAASLAYTVTVTIEPVAHSAAILVLRAATDRPAQLHETVINAMEALRAQPIGADSFTGAAAVLRSRLLLESSTPKAALLEQARFRLTGRPPRHAGILQALESLDPEGVRDIAEAALDPKYRTTVLVSGAAEADCHTMRSVTQ